MDHLYKLNRACGAIDQGSGADCDDIPEGGTRARVLLANYDNIVGYEESGGVITGITMAGGATFYEFTGFRNDMKKSEEVIKPEIGMPKFKHAVSLVIYERTQEQKNNIESMVKGNVVAIVELLGKDDTAIEVVGKGVGLSIVAGVIRDAYANGGYFVVNLATPDDEGKLESKLPQTLLVTDYAETLTYLAGLLPASS